MIWLASLKTKLYALIGIAFAAIIGWAKYQGKRREIAEKDAKASKENLRVVIKSHDIELAIDEINAEKAQDRNEAHWKNIKDLGELKNDIKNLTDEQLIDNVNELRRKRYSKFKNSR